MSESQIIYGSSVTTAALSGLTIAIVGYGAQGQAHALNLRDSGCRVIIGQRSGGRGWQEACQDGFEPQAIAQAVSSADIVALLVPDEYHQAVFQSDIAPAIKSGATVLTCHGFSFHYGLVDPRPHQHRLLVAPKGQGHMVRNEYLQGGGVPCLVAVDDNGPPHVWQQGLAYAAALGCGHAGIIRTTMAAETETDLFGEQVVLCGGLTHLVQAGFETLVEAGYQPELAYFECLHELKIIADLLHRSGIAAMRDAISTTAEYGDVTRGPQIIDDHVRQKMKRVLSEIQSGQFAGEFLEQSQQGSPRLRDARNRQEQQLIESVGARLRQHMPWLQKQTDP